MERIEVEPLDMSGIVEEVRRRLAGKIEEYGAEITFPETWPAVVGYGPWVEEVLVNYISNAIKYGGRPPRVQIGATEQADGSVRFWVRDNGPGLTLEEQNRLFTPFRRLNQARATGHGLGLSIVRRIVERLGGHVGVKSEVSEGSTFVTTQPGHRLTATYDQSARNPGLPATYSHPRYGEKVLFLASIATYGGCRDDG